MPDETNKKLDYLKREEVRTMGKDVAELREQESEITRKKITQIKTGEETGMEAERIEQSRRAAQEREELEAKAKRKEEELKKAREEAGLREGGLRLEESEREEKERELLRAQLREAQLKEEGARRKFLEDVTAKAEGRVAEERPPVPPPTTPIRPAPPTPPLPAEPVTPPPVPPPLPSKPTPPPVPTPLVLPILPKKPFKFPKLPSFRLPKIKLPRVQLPEVRLPKVEGYFPQKPSIFAKIWIRLIISLFVLAVLATLITFWYWYLVVRPRMPEIALPAGEIVQEKPEIIQRLLQSGYYLPVSVRIIDAIIIHSGYNTPDGDPYDLESAIQSYKTTGVAVHYLISREGAVFQLAPDYAVAYHAGNANNTSVGISLIYQESEGPNEVQYQSLSRLIKDLQRKYNIPTENILGYKDIVPGKTTPWNFDWDKFKLLISFAPASPNNGAEFIFKNLTQEEKIGQLLMIGFEGTVLTLELENLIKTVRPGGIILFKKNIEGPSQIKKLLQDLQKISLAETGLPLLVTVDQEGGVVSRIDFAKEKTGQPVIESADQAYKVGLERGRELGELGINLNLSPLLDLTRSGDFLHQRSFQKEAEETGILAKALVSGQKAAGILTAIKHFPGYGGISFNPEEKLATLANIPQTSHFQKVMEAGPEFVMTANAIYPSIDANLPLTFSIKGIAFLKERLGENPLIMTDDLPQKSLLDVFSLKKAVTLPIRAGVDILLFSDQKSGIDAASILKEAVRTGNISEELINRIALRIIQLKVCKNCGKPL